jgi:hypothetical protein
LFKFGANLVHGQYVLLKDKQPDPALPVRGGFEDKRGFVDFRGPDLEERRKQVDELKKTQSRSAVGLLNPNLAGYEAAMNVSPLYAGHYRLAFAVGIPMESGQTRAVRRAAGGRIAGARGG